MPDAENLPSGGDSHQLGACRGQTARRLGVRVGEHVGADSGDGWRGIEQHQALPLTSPAATRAAVALDRYTLAPADCSASAVFSRPCGSPEVPMSETTTATPCSVALRT